MPLYDKSLWYERKAGRILSLVFETGNFGQGRDMSYKQKNSFFVRLSISFSRHTKDVYRQFMIFPSKAIWVWVKMIVKGVRFAATRYWILQSVIVELLQEFINNEARSCSMDYGRLTPLYVYRSWGCTVSLEDIMKAWPRVCRIIWTNKSSGQEKAHGAAAFVAARCAWGAEGSFAGLTANVPEAVDHFFK